MRKRQGFGSTTDKVFDILKAAGYEPDCITPATGYWKQADVYRWECTLKIGNFRECCGCWQTMTTFIKYAKNGITINKDMEIWANEEVTQA